MEINNLIQNLNKNRSYKIVFLGDSLTSAEFVHPNWREIVEYVIKETTASILPDWKLPYWGIKFINSGYDGSTTNDWLKMYKNSVLSYKPDMVIVFGTTNDMELKIGVDVTKKNLGKILKNLVKIVPKVVYLSGLTTNNLEYNSRYEPYLEATKSIIPEGVDFINIFEEYANYNLEKFFTFRSDGNEVLGIKEGQLDFVHPNQLGNAYIAKIILEKIFNIPFDPEMYISDVNLGKMYPKF